MALVPNMLYFILLLLLSSFTLQDCASIDADKISKYEAIATTTSSPILKHLLSTGIVDSEVKIAKVPDEAKSFNKELQNYNYKIHDDSGINQKRKDLGENVRIDILESKMNDNKKDSSSSNTTTDLSKFVYSKFASALKNRLHQIIAYAFSQHNIKTNSSEISSDVTFAHSMKVTNSSEKKSDEISSSSEQKVPTGRQFVFHPYLPYGKDVAPDEKISIGDVLPVKMVKFFKDMVEEAPWEQMFQKMVRMIVDQFVDKIIEKLFAHKDDEHDEWRSSDGGSAKPTWSLSKNVLTYVVRSRRSTAGKAKSDHVQQDWIEKDLKSSNRVSKEDRAKTKESTDEESWLDSILDYLFPDDPKAADAEKDRRKRRTADQPMQEIGDQISGIMRSFLGRYMRFQTDQPTPHGINAILKDSIRHQMFEIMSPDNSNQTDSEMPTTTSSSVSTVSDASLEPKMTVDASEKSSLRAKRSTPTNDDTDKDEEEERLWQANRRTRPSNRKSRDDCSLRRACNAGRLLSRLPSVQDITLQLKAYGNEPHWDALLWGMTKKRCSRIFCKRQRSPKGTRHHWDGPEKRFHKKSTPSSRSSRLKNDESDLTTIYPV